MIVKFDHISYSCSIKEEEKVRGMFEGYHVEFYETDLKNMPMKFPYMHAEQEKHNIILLSKAGSYPVEITAYEICRQRQEGVFAKYVVKDDLIEIYSVNPKKTIEFFELVGMKMDEEGDLWIKPMLDERVLKIKVCQAEQGIKVHLDEEGFGSLAFVVDNAKRHKEQLLNGGVLCSEIEELFVNGKKLKIFFTNSPTNEIIEFIGLR